MSGGSEGESRWSYTAGRRPYRVRVYERTDRSNLYVAVWDPEEGVVKRSLGHADRERAKDRADELAPKIRAGAERLAEEEQAAILRRVFRLYRRHKVPDKSEEVRAGDERRMKRWTRFLGPEFDLADLSAREWDSFKRKRRSGAVDASGEPVPASRSCPDCGGEGCSECGGSGEIDPRRPVGDRTLEKDLRFIRAVCAWATRFRGEDGERLLDRNPTDGLAIPKEQNPKRPVATHDRVDAIREVYRRPTMRVERGGKRERVESYLPEVFEIVVGTGRRISAVCELREEDLELERTEKAPHGAIRWPEDTDKMGKAWRCPISEPVREAVEAARRKRRAVGPGPLFPRPGNGERALRYEDVSRWLRRAEELAAGVEPHDGSLWHAYRRLWASARKHLPDVDVARAGGWDSLAAFKTAYQQPDDATLLHVVENEAELREVK